MDIAVTNMVSQTQISSCIEVSLQEIFLWNFLICPLISGAIYDWQGSPNLDREPTRISDAFISSLVPFYLLCTQEFQDSQGVLRETHATMLFWDS